MPKEGLAGTSSAKPTFGMTPTLELYFVFFRDYILSQYRTSQAFFCHDNDKDLLGPFLLDAAQTCQRKSQELVHYLHRLR